MDLILIRALFALFLTAAGFMFSPFGLPRWAGAAAGLILSALILLFEYRLQRITLKRLIGAAIGSLLGILGAFLVSLILAQALPKDSDGVRFLQVTILVWMWYCGLVVGSAKGELLNLAALGGIFGEKSGQPERLKILDTSVIIDGRIADIAQTGFLDGGLIIPQFVLRELQLVADSGDSNKRSRGRRGLDILKSIQSIPSLRIQIVEDDFPAIREVDLKLLELAKLYGAKIVTNDFNLNKVAQLHKVEVLNINELANALKPVVLPGETMRVFILKEGKEHNQGVAYLDDGTMVVVDGARRLISKTIDIVVTSVLQTTAGKMIFGRVDDRSNMSNQSAAAAGGGASAERVRPEHSAAPTVSPGN